MVVNLIEITGKGEMEEQTTPILRAMEQIGKLEPEVILLFINKDNTQLLLRQVTKLSIFSHVSLQVFVSNLIP